MTRLVPSLLAGLFFVTACLGAPGSEPTPHATVQLGTPVPLIAALPPSPTGEAASGTAVPQPKPAAAANPTTQAAASPSPLAADSTTLTIGTDMGTEERFEPDMATVKSGLELVVVFNNESTLPHNLAFQKPMSGYTQLVLAPGQSDTIRVTTPGPGSYQFVCTIHPLMVGTLYVEP